MKISVLPFICKRNEYGYINGYKPVLKVPIICSTFADCERNVNSLRAQIKEHYKTNDVYFDIDLCFN